MFRNGTLARSPPTNWLSQNINLQLRKISSHAVPGVRLCRFRKAPRRAANARFCRPAVLQRRDASRFLAPPRWPGLSAPSPLHGRKVASRLLFHAPRSVRTVSGCMLLI